MQQCWSRWKPYWRIVILVATLVFLGKILQKHAREVAAIRIEGTGWACLAIALGITLLAHIWAGWVWGWMLQELEQPVSGVWAIQTYLKTNIAKYLPSNVLHLYGRTLAATEAGVSLAAATLSVLLEALLMAGASLSIALVSSTWKGWNGLLSLAALLLLIHPRILNRGIQSCNHFRGRAAPENRITFTIKRYPLRPLLGELGFLGLRSSGFVLTVAALTPISLPAMPLLIRAFSMGWLLGFVTPGAPGGLGIFEVTVLTLLEQASQLQASLSPGLVLSAVALYRLISTLAEAIGAGLAWLSERHTRDKMVDGDGGT